MKAKEIKTLVSTFSQMQLVKAAEDLQEGLPLEINVEGEDEGEQLTHLLAAAEVCELMKDGIDLNQAFRAFSQRVRNSISSC